MIPEIPPPAGKRIPIHLTPPAERQIRAGHPWLFESGIAKQSHAGKAGDLAVLFDRKRRFLAIGLYDPTSPIRVRVLQANQPATIDKRWLAGKLAITTKIRAELPAQTTTGYRLVHGENDGLPGLIVDRYGELLVLKLYTSAWLPWLRWIVPALVQLSSPTHIILRLSRQLIKQQKSLFGLGDGTFLHGAPFDGVVTFTENGLTFEADLLRGQKTGFFLDQRENRARVETMAKGRNMLNLFAYTGGFSLYGARGGAISALSVDTSLPALTTAQRNFQLNNQHPTIRECRHTTWQIDCFEALHKLNNQRRQFGLIVVDPPAFAKRKSEIPQALAAYRRLMQLTVPLVANGGYLVASSCSSRISAEQFYELVSDTVENAGRPHLPIAHTTHAIDHPITFSQGAYLKTIFLQVNHAI